jgi:predicted nucleic acid-binding protein
VGSVTRVLLDSDVLIDHLRGHHRIAIGGDTVHISTVTRADLFAGRGSDERLVRRLLDPFVELPVNRAVAERAGRIRRTSRSGMADALIAATAIQHRLTLVTRNSGDFASVSGLRLRSPRES